MKGVQPETPYFEAKYVMPGRTYFNLDRFIAAQAPVYDKALSELRAGRKQSHWMWFIFPQLQGLGRSPMAELFGLQSLDHARQYLANPILGPRLISCTCAVNAVEGVTLHDIFGSPDDLKFRSSMTLFALVEPEADGVFREALNLWCGGVMDPHTLALLDANNHQN